MWFKNLQIYRFTRPFDVSLEDLEKQLEALPFTPCGSQEQSKFGWVSPLGKHGQALTHIADEQILLCAKKEDKMLPGSVINDMVAEKVEAIELEQGRALKKKEKDSIKEEIIVDLLPRAFSRFQQTFAWINPKDGFIAVDASSAKRAEDLLALLRKSIGSLPVVPLAMSTPPELTLTEWLKEGAAPAGFQLEDEVELRSALEHGGIILSDDMSVKRLKFSEELREQNDDVTNEDVAARFDADFALVTGELSRFVPDLIEALGGEEKQ